LNYHLDSEAQEPLGEPDRYDALFAELKESQARENKLSRRVDELSRRDVLLSNELSHRFLIKSAS